jgi:hypothetical protein
LRSVALTTNENQWEHCHVIFLKFFPPFSKRIKIFVIMFYSILYRWYEPALFYLKIYREKSYKNCNNKFLFTCINYFCHGQQGSRCDGGCWGLATSTFLICLPEFFPRYICEIFCCALVFDESGRQYRISIHSSAHCRLSVDSGRQCRVSVHSSAQCRLSVEYKKRF